MNIAFVSPSTKDNSTIADAVADRSGRELLKAEGITPGIGFWSDGAEVSGAFHDEDPSKLLRRAAELGKRWRQKGIIAFTERKHGADLAHVIRTAETDPHKLDKELGKAGVEYKTVVPHPYGSVVHVLDQGGQLEHGLREWAGKTNAKIRTIKGHVHFVGHEDREMAQHEFDRVLNGEQLVGGKADDKPDSQFKAEDVARGQKVEAEHTSSPSQTKEIAKDHLTEDPKYYQKLAKVKLAQAEQPKPSRTNQKALAITKAYYEKKGIPFDPNPSTLKQDPVNSRRVAKLYERLPHNPSHPAVKQSYDALKREVRDQYDHLIEHGVQLHPIAQEHQTYPNSAALREDVAKNNRLTFNTTTNQGETDATNPLMEHTGVTAHGVPLRYNDMLRAVHDYFGHAVHGHEFGPLGELRTWHEHAKMFSPEARPALATETHGQNSALNFSKKNEGRPIGQREYAPQKANVLPKKVWPVKLARKKPVEVSNVAALAATAIDNPHDDTPFRILADHLEEHHGNDPHAQSFMRWVREPDHNIANDVTDHELWDNPVHGSWGGGGFMVHRNFTNPPMGYPGHLFHRPVGSATWKSGYNPRKRLSTPEVAEAVYRKGSFDGQPSLPSLLNVVVSSRLKHNDENHGSYEPQTFHHKGPNVAETPAKLARKIAHRTDSHSAALATSYSVNNGKRREIAMQILKEAGLQPAAVRNVLLHEKGKGVKSTVMTAIQKRIDPKLAGYVASWFGLLAREKALTVFHPHESGQDRLHVLQTQMDPAALGEYMNGVGVPKFLIEEAHPGSRAYVYSPQGQLDSHVQRVVGGTNASHSQFSGTGFRLGSGPGSDADARADYRGTISSFEAQATGGKAATPASSGPTS